MISKGSIDAIFEAARIEEVVSDFVVLKKAGSNYKGLSPFTDEKTPSFFVSPAKGIFKDFSSGKGGNAVSFLMELENMSYPEALRYLADKYRIEIEETGVDPKDKEEQNLRESLVLVNKFALEHFTENLWKTEEGKSIGLSYFRERGFSDPTIKKFALGYSLDQNDAFLKKAREAGYSTDHMSTLGLIKDGNYGKYDFFRGRVIFPIRNISGRPIAFAGRTLKSDNKVKYINSPESELYDKSNTLYGLYEAKQSIIRDDMCFLVEGYTDVIALHQAGIEYAVASSGTSLTPGQAKLIHRYSKNVTLLYDGDSAGVKAALRGIDILLEEGLQVKVILFPEGHDPDSFSRSVSQTELTRYFDEKSVDFTDFMIDVLLEGKSNDPIKKAEATRRIVESLSHIRDHIARSIYVEQCSKKLNIPEKALLNELNKILRKKQLRRSGVDPELIPEPPQSKDDQISEIPLIDHAIWEKEIARVLVNYGDRTIKVDVETEDGKDEKVEVKIAEYILHDLSQDEIEFHSPVYSRILMEYMNKIQQDGALPEMASLVREPDMSEAIAAMITSPYELSTNWEEKHKIYTDTEEKNLQRTVFDPLMRLKLNKVKTMLKEVEEAIKKADTEEELHLHLQEKMKLDRMKVEVSNFFGSAII